MRSGVSFTGLLHRIQRMILLISNLKKFKMRMYQSDSPCMLISPVGCVADPWKLNGPELIKFIVGVLLSI